MNSYGKLALLGVGVVGLALAGPRAASSAPRCEVVIGTGSGVDKSEAIVKSRSAMEEEIPQRKALHGWRGVSVRAHRTRPYPFFKDREITPAMILKPDVVSGRAYTRCWHGVVAPYVCSSGASVCGR